ncbi:glycosyltransferase [Botryobacter ruber]|uniref:glycosyltransferase n=1 Tax=Botryobacter ruber TaxID=2171629 RepID=UPI000E0A68EF|nr:glycosyltransferase [Botryobacter ruber]
MSKKKILIIPTYFPTTGSPLSGTQVLEQSELIQADYEVKVLFCIRQDITRKRYYFNKLKNHLRLKQYISCSDQILSGALESRGFYYNCVIGNSDEKNFSFCIHAYKTLLENLITENWKPDLIHARTAEHAGLIACQLSEHFSIPFIITENCALLFDQTFSVFKFKSYFQAIEKASKVAFVSNYLMKLVLMHGVKCNTHIIGNLIDEGRFTIKNEVEEATGKFKILIIGYNAYIKDFLTFFKALQYIVEQGHQDIAVDIIVTFYWSEENKNELMKLAEEHNVLQYCNFSYQVPRNEISRFFQQTGVFVSTSITETFGIACCEAMLCGKPVVATANGGIDDFISPENGIKVQLKDFKAIGDNIIKIKTKELIFDPEKVRNSIVKKYGREAFTTNLKSLYDNVLSNN